MRWIDRSRLACALAASMLVALAASRAEAQTEADLERARTAFAEGVQLTAEERWAEAAARFREVITVRATPQVRFNLAVALYHSDEIPEAVDLLAQVVDDDALDRRTRREARRMLDEARPRLARITIHIRGDEAGASVLVDDREVGLERIGQPMSVMPGTHRIVLRRSEQVVARSEVSVAQGELEEVTLVPVAVAVAPVVPVDEELPMPEEPPPPSGGDVTGEWWFWTAIGVGVLAVAGVVVGVAVATSGPPGQEAPVQGNLQPGVIDVALP